MRRKQQKRCSKVYTKSAACFSTYKLDLRNTEVILYSSAMFHDRVPKIKPCYASYLRDAIIDIRFNILTFTICCCNPTYIGIFRTG